MNNQTLKIKNSIQLVPATIEDYPIVQNLARFYVYEMSRTCGFRSTDWNIPQDGLYECADFKEYFIDADKKSFLVKFDTELVGFVLIQNKGIDDKADWNMGEFFILAKFQGKGIGKKIAYDIWNTFRGKWNVSVIPENTPAKEFWLNAIKIYTDGKFEQIIKIVDVDFDKDKPERIFFTFTSN